MDHNNNNNNFSRQTALTFGRVTCCITVNQFICLELIFSREYFEQTDNQIEVKNTISLKVAKSGSIQSCQDWDSVVFQQTKYLFNVSKYRLSTTIYYIIIIAQRRISLGWC